MKKRNINIKFWKFCVLMTIVLSINGCAPKTTRDEISNSSIEILNQYAEKPAPENYFWNFGIGSSYGDALKDAQKSLLVNDYSSLEYEYSKIGEKNFINIREYNLFVNGKSCDIHKNVKVPEGYLIIRLCKDFKSIRVNANKYQDKYAKPDFQLRLYNLLNNEEKKLNSIKNEENILKLRVIKDFRKNLETSMSYIQFEHNYFGESDQDILNFIYGEWKEWKHKLFLYLPGNYTEYVYFPYYLYYDTVFNIEDSPQYWAVNGIDSKKFKFSINDRISSPALQGIIDIPKKSGIYFINPKIVK